MKSATNNKEMLVEYREFISEVSNRCDHLQILQTYLDNLQERLSTIPMDSTAVSLVYKMYGVINFLSDEIESLTTLQDNRETAVLTKYHDEIVKEYKNND